MRRDHLVSWPPPKQLAPTRLKPLPEVDKRPSRRAVAQSLWANHPGHKPAPRAAFLPEEWRSPQGSTRRVISPLMTTHLPQYGTQPARSTPNAEAACYHLPIDPTTLMRVVAARADVLRAPQKEIVINHVDPPLNSFATTSQRPPTDLQKKPPVLFQRTAEHPVQSGLPANESEPPACAMSSSVRAAVATPNPY